MSSPQRISILLCGKKYAITTSQDEALVRKAVQKIEAAIQEIEKQAMHLKDDQKILFGALRAVMDTMADGKDVERFVHDMTEKITAALL